MKQLLIALTAIILLNSCTNPSEQKAKQSGQEIYFAQSTYDYGQIEEDSDGIYTIQFKNIGKDAVVINRVRATCGCTIPSWPRKPIEPGEEGEIDVKYNTALLGSFMKSIHVYSTASNSPVKLVVKGKVIPKKMNETDANSTPKPEMPE